MNVKGNYKWIKKVQDDVVQWLKIEKEEEEKERG